MFGIFRRRRRELSEYDRLPAETQAAVDKAVAETERTGNHTSHPHKNGDVYAYPYAGGGTAWGVNGGKKGFNIARDVKR